jgi:two-component system, NtrC family, response regulator GlrR
MSRVATAENMKITYNHGEPQTAAELDRHKELSVGEGETRTKGNSNGLTQELRESLGLKQFLGESQVFIAAILKIRKLARCDASVFVTGETGTGKEMCARAIHHLGPRADHPFIPVNCGAIPVDLVENELFGHDSGAFTSASSAVRGLVYDAEGGTLFLDEVDSLPLQTQVKLLRFLQDQQYRPLGARKLLRADVRIIAACNTDPEEAVRSRRFRSDLFYRLNVLPLKLPALRERREDIPLLARHFLAKYAKEDSTVAKELSRDALEKLVAYDWPGNVRELQNIIERAVVLSERPIITREDVCLPESVASVEELSFKALKAHAIAEFETGYLRRVLATNDWNISKAARAAKKNRRAFWQLMRNRGVAVPTSAAASLSHRTNLDQPLDKTVLGNKPY